MTDPTIKNRDIVVIGLQPWYYEIGSNCKNMARHFALHNRVLYVNAPINRKTALSSNKTKGVEEHYKTIKEGGETVRPIAENFWEFSPPTIVESINWLPSTQIFKPLMKINNRRFARDLQKAIDKLGFKNIILFNDNDIFNGYYLKEYLQPSSYIYYSRDFIQGYDYFRKHGESLEPQLLRKADLAVANSIFLANYCSKYNSNSHYIGQGCNIENFNPEKHHDKPADLASIKSPIIGYVGAIISERLDIKIIEIIADSHPDWSVVMVGPEDDTFASSSLHSKPNVHFLGRKPLEELPAYVASFDVCINPQLVNNITIGNYPLKIDEYLAMGKPVVATYTETMRLFENHTLLAKSPQEYPSLIEKALLQNSEEVRMERIRFARTHTWENCMLELYKAMRKGESIKAKGVGA